MKFPVIILASLLLSYCQKKEKITSHSNYASDTLVVGDQAPPLKILRWLKGDSISEFKKDSIYIIEMGFASCTPCRASIPHLTSITKKYAGRIRVISVHIWENDASHPEDISYIKKVNRYLENIGDKIAYDVAVDVPEQTTANTWGGGAPKAFVVGRNGKILWIGHPDYLDTVLQKILAETFDPNTTAEIQKNEQQYMDQKMNEAWESKKAGDFSSAINITNSLIEKFPANYFFLYEKYRILDGMDSDNNRANDWVKWLLQTKPRIFHAMYYLTHAILNSKAPNYDLAIAMADWALEESIYNYSSAFILDAKAKAFYKKGDYQTALNLQEKAIGLIKPDTKEMEEAIGTLNIWRDIYQKAISGKEKKIK